MAMSYGRLSKFSPAFRWGLIEARRRIPRCRAPGGFPRHFAGASLKRANSPDPNPPMAKFSPAFRWGLIEARLTSTMLPWASGFSPAFRWGLIEAIDLCAAAPTSAGFSPAFRWGLIEAAANPLSEELCRRGFPRHFAGASLKHDLAGRRPHLLFVLFSPAFRWGLIEARQSAFLPERISGFPRHFAGASLKPFGRGHHLPCVGGFPRHFAGASLKLSAPGRLLSRPCTFSSAFRWGLIEACDWGRVPLC